MPRGSEQYLKDILSAIQAVGRFTDGLDEAGFLADELRQHGTLYDLMVVGEAVKRLPDELQAQVPSVPWREIERFRDKLVHHYFSIRPEIVWQIVQEDLPVLRAAVETLLNADTDDHP
jgi:uncharacterized protein with HEPN domain